VTSEPSRSDEAHVIAAESQKEPAGPEPNPADTRQPPNSNLAAGSRVDLPRLLFADHFSASTIAGTMLCV
jgi:hypothetical protein